MRVYSYTVDMKGSDKFWWLTATDCVVITGVKDSEHEYRDVEINHKLLDRSFDFDIADAINHGTEDGVKLWQIIVSDGCEVELGFLSEKDKEFKKKAFITSFVSLIATSYATNGEIEGRYLISKSKNGVTIIEYDTSDYLKERQKIILDFEKRTKTFIISD